MASLKHLTIASSEQEAASTLVLVPETISRCLLSLTQAFGINMQCVALTKVELCEDGRLVLYPDGTSYEFIYRAAAGVVWEPQSQCLHFGAPGALSYIEYYRQIASVVASEYGHRLMTTEKTEWRNVPAPLRSAIEAAS